MFLCWGQVFNFRVRTSTSEPPVDGSKAIKDGCRLVGPVEEYICPHGCCFPLLPSFLCGGNVARLGGLGPRVSPSCPLIGCCPAAGGSPLRTTAVAPGTIESLRRKHTLSLESKNVISPADAFTFCLQQEGCFLFLLQISAFTGLCR